MEGIVRYDEGILPLWYNRPFLYTNLVVPPEVSVIQGVYSIVLFVFLFIYEYYRITVCHFTLN